MLYIHPILIRLFETNSVTTIKKCVNTKYRQDCGKQDSENQIPQ